MNNQKPTGYTVFPAILVILVFGMLTLADAPGPPLYGHSLFLDNNKVFVASGYYLYSSTDGGLTWKSEDENIFEFVDEQFQTTQYIEIPDTRIAYRIANNGNIEKSINEGESWQILHKYETIPSIDIYYYSVIRPDSKHINIYPGDMIYDPVTGNVILANSFAGIAVINSAGEYIPVQVDDYIPVDRHVYIDSYVFERLMGSYLLSALYLFFVLINFWIIFSGEGFFRFVVLISILTWILLVETSYSIAYIGIYFYFISIFFILTQVLLTIVHLQYLKYTMKPHWKTTMCFALIGSLFFLTPYLLWYFGFLEVSASTWISYSLILLWAVFIIRKYHFMVKEKDIGIWKEYNISFFWKRYVFRIYHLADKGNNDDKK